MTAADPYKEEDEGYIAAETGLALNRNPYPTGTIRHDHWRQGWRTRQIERQDEGNEGYLADTRGFTLADNPHPPGTIRFEQWRRGWMIRQDQRRRALRLQRASSESDA